MHDHSRTSWSVPMSFLALAGGAALLGLGFGLGQSQPSPMAMAAGGILLVVGASLLAVSAVYRVRHDACDRKLHKYGCPKCGYEAHLGNIEASDPEPCPRCGRPVYQ
jgi:predicted RNA-binding Zn-ribbon protein involved in translation (DUF1610 family)